MNPYYIAMIALAVILLGISVYEWIRPDEGEGGFKEWVRNPKWRKWAEVQLAAKHSVTVPDDITIDQIRSLVERLFVESDEDFNIDKLRLVGAKAVPLLIEALQDPRTAKMVFRQVHSLDGESPFERICDLLEPLGPPEAVPAIVPYASHSNPQFRKRAVWVLGSIGTADCLEPVLAGLHDKDEEEDVADWAMMGIDSGLHAGRSTRGFLDGLFLPVSGLSAGDSSTIGELAPKVLLAIDDRRACDLLLSPERFQAENAQLMYVIPALVSAGHQIPHSLLLPLLNALKPRSDEYPHNYQYAAALEAYAKNPDAGAEPTIREALESTNKTVREGAANSLAVLFGMSDPNELVYEAENRIGFEGLSEPQKLYSAVFMYDAEVNNGGHAQYFVNSSGSRWELAIAGLRAIGATKRVAILSEATALFGTAGPATDDDLRHKQLAKLQERKSATLDALDERYHAYEENVQALLTMYAIENRAQFTSRHE